MWNFDHRNWGRLLGVNGAVAAKFVDLPSMSLFAVSPGQKCFEVCSCVGAQLLSGVFFNWIAFGA